MCMKWNRVRSYDRVSVFSQNPFGSVLATGTLIGNFCNMNRPKGPIESQWNILQITFISDASVASQGFWATYRGIQYEADVATNSSFVGKHTVGGQLTEGYDFTVIS